LDDELLSLYGTVEFIPPVSKSLSYNCGTAELLDTSKRILKTEVFDNGYNEREH